MSALKRIFPTFFDLNIYTCRVINHSFRIATRACSNSTENQPKIANKDIEINPNFYNRNPRALEHTGLAKKEKGWKFQYPPKEFYHRLVLELTTRQTSARVEHNSGAIVVSASTQEFAIAKHLHSMTDVSAAQNIGRVLAQRCCQCGITNMTLLPPDLGSQSEKFEMFEKAITEGGIALWEPDEVQPDYEPGIDYDNEEEVASLFERQWKVRDLSKQHVTILKYRSRRAGSRIRKPIKPEPIIKP